MPAFDRLVQFCRLSQDHWQGCLARDRANVALRAFIDLAGPYDLPLEDPVVVGKLDNLSYQLEANPLALASSQHFLNPAFRDIERFLHKTAAPYGSAFE